MEREAHFLGGVFFGLKVFPKSGIAWLGVRGAPDGLALLLEQGGCGRSEAVGQQQQRHDKTAASAGTGLPPVARFPAVPLTLPAFHLKPDPFSSRYAPPPFRKG